MTQLPDAQRISPHEPAKERRRRVDDREGSVAAPLLLGGIGVTLDYRLSDSWNDPVLTIPGWEIFAASVAVLLAAAWAIEIPELLAVGRRELFEEESER